jgi:hypothetical protein
MKVTFISSSTNMTYTVVNGAVTVTVSRSALPAPSSTATPSWSPAVVSVPAIATDSAGASALISALNTAIAIAQTLNCNY